jgi:hypothetical protein
MFRRLAAATMAVSMWAAPAVAGGPQVVEGVFNFGDETSFAFDAIWWRYYHGTIEVSGADLESATLISEALGVYNVFAGSTPDILYPIHYECTAAVGESCGYADSVGLTNVSSTNLAFDTPTLYVLYALDGMTFSEPGNRHPTGEVHTKVVLDFGDQAWTAISYRMVYTIEAVPEPQSWALMILGFAAVGSALRRRPALGAHA